MRPALALSLMFLCGLPGCGPRQIPDTGPSTSRETDQCRACHGSKDRLIATAGTEQAPPPSYGRTGSVWPLEPWAKVYVDLRAVDASAHNQPCTSCHGGDATAQDKDAAHVGLVADPSETVSACGDCHQAESAAAAGSIHLRLTGMRAMVERRAGQPMDEAMEAGLEASCSGCHATCGSCHVARPDVVGGGFLKGHLFVQTPDPILQCGACHGTRLAEYAGTDGGSPDVHTLDGSDCNTCHGAAEMHGGGPDRYHVAGAPRCDDCHPDLLDTNIYHQAHLGDLSCEPCHSEAYESCASCHVPDGLQVAPWTAFKIGRSPVADRPEAFVTLRHDPIRRGTYAEWGLPVLAQYDAWPSWTLATPHNTQLWTERTEVQPGERCSTSCHGTPATPEGWFLRQVDLDDRRGDPAANAALILGDRLPR